MGERAEEQTDLTIHTILFDNFARTFKAICTFIFPYTNEAEAREKGQTRNKAFLANWKFKWRRGSDRTSHLQKKVNNHIKNRVSSTREAQTKEKLTFAKQIKLIFHLILLYLHVFARVILPFLHPPLFFWIFCHLKFFSSTLLCLFCLVFSHLWLFTQLYNKHLSPF